LVPTGDGGFKQDGWVTDDKHKLKDAPHFEREAITKEKLVEWGFNDMLALEKKQDLDTANGLFARMNQRGSPEQDAARRAFRMDFARFLNMDNKALAQLSEELVPLIKERAMAIADAEAKQKAAEVRETAVPNFFSTLDKYVKDRIAGSDEARSEEGF